MGQRVGKCTSPHKTLRCTCQQDFFFLQVWQPLLDRWEATCTWDSVGCCAVALTLCTFLHSNKNDICVCAVYSVCGYILLLYVHIKPIKRFGSKQPIQIHFGLQSNNCKTSNVPSATHALCV